MKECNCRERLHNLHRIVIKDTGSAELLDKALLCCLSFNPDSDYSDNTEETLSTEEIIDETLGQIVGGLTLAGSSFNPFDKLYKYNFTLGEEVEFDLVDKNGSRVKFTVKVGKQLKV